MTSLDEALAATEPEPVTAVSLVPGRHAHTWTVCACGALRDLAAPRRGKSADRLGKDNERRIERVYGPRKVGEFGDAVDLIGRDFVWQAKATRRDVPIWWAVVDLPEWRSPPSIVVACVAAMEPLRAHRAPLVIQSYVEHGRRTLDRIWVRAADWARLHGGDEAGGWRVMSGEAFLEVHGRDEERTA